MSKTDKKEIWHVYLNASPNKEIDQHRFHLGLTTLEVIPANQTVPLNSQINQS
jgi:hypothetical protein